MFGNSEKKENRFKLVRREKISKEYDGTVMVIVDTFTGIQYIHLFGPNNGGVTILVDKDGKPLLHEGFLTE